VALLVEEAHVTERDEPVALDVPARLRIVVVDEVRERWLTRVDEAHLAAGQLPAALVEDADPRLAGGPSGRAGDRKGVVEGKGGEECASPVRVARGVGEPNATGGEEPVALDAPARLGFVVEDEAGERWLPRVEEPPWAGGQPPAALVEDADPRLAGGPSGRA